MAKERKIHELSPWDDAQKMIAKARREGVNMRTGVPPHVLDTHAVDAGDTLVAAHAHVLTSRWTPLPSG